MDTRCIHEKPSGHLSLHWLGTPGIEIDGQPVRLETQKALALLAYLSLAEQPVPREALAAMFWPEFDQSHAFANLRRNLASLDKSLGYCWIDANRSTISLAKDHNMSIDVINYFDLLWRARHHCPASTKPCHECLLLLEEAVSLYRGDFLACLNFRDCNSFDEWQYFEREDASQEMASALQQLAEGYLHLDDKERAIRYARRWVKLDRLNEEAQRLLIKVYAEAGQQGAAIRQFEECRRLLHEEFDQEPELETIALVEKIATRRSSGKKMDPFVLPALFANGGTFEPLHGSCSALTMQHYRMAHQDPLD